MTRQQAIDALGQCAQELMTGPKRTLVRIGYDLEGIRVALMSDSERDADYANAAAALGRIGGAKTSDAKAAAARANGEKGGRPPKRDDWVVRARWDRHPELTSVVDLRDSGLIDEGQRVTAAEAVSIVLDCDGEWFFEQGGSGKMPMPDSAEIVE